MKKMNDKMSGQKKNKKKYNKQQKGGEKRAE